MGIFYARAAARRPANFLEILPHQAQVKVTTNGVRPFIPIVATVTTVGVLSVVSTVGVRGVAPVGGAEPR